MSEKIIEIIISSILGTGILSTVINLIANALSNKKSRLKNVEAQLTEVNEQLKEIQGKQDISERDALRTQLLVMISDYPDETMDILKLAQHYFKDLHGNWTATMLFNRWLESRKIAKPSWFNYRDEE